MPAMTPSKSDPQVLRATGDWTLENAPALLEFTKAVTKLRHDHPTFRRSRFFDGRPVRRGEGEKLPDIVWLKTDGTEMLPEDWDSGFGRTIGCPGLHEKARANSGMLDTGPIARNWRGGKDRGGAASRSCREAGGGGASGHGPPGEDHRNPAWVA